MFEIVIVIGKFLKHKLNNGNEQFWHREKDICLWSQSLSSMKLSRFGGNR